MKNKKNIVIMDCDEIFFKFSILEGDQKKVFEMVQTIKGNFWTQVAEDLCLPNQELSFSCEREKQYCQGQ